MQLKPCQTALPPSINPESRSDVGPEFETHRRLNWQSTRQLPMRRMRRGCRLHVSSKCRRTKGVRASGRV